MRALAREQLQLVPVDVDRVREDHVFARDIHRIEVFDVTQARFPLDHLYLEAVLGGMGVDQDSAFARERRDPA